MDIGRYEVMQELGQGGMAIVYLARDPYMKRQVAVKVLPRQFTFDPQFRTRFQREAEVIATLEHPSIVPVYDFGSHEDQPYIVMRYMSGGTLADLLTEGPLPISDIASLFERIAGAVDYAHSLGVIHRDIKPGNILFDSRGETYLSDFGIAKIAESTAAFTGTGIIGTPAYMSPEQAQGEKTLNGRCDVYSLGVVLFESLSGELPFKADTPMGVALAHIREPIPSLLERRADLPPAFETVIRKALEKDPDQRYQTAAELSRAIQQAIGAMDTLPENKTVIEHLNRTMIEPIGGAHAVEAPVYSATPPAPPQAVPAQAAYISTVPPAPAARRIAFPRRLGLGAIGILAFCLCAGLIGGFASGLIPNPFASPPTQMSAPSPSEPPTVSLSESPNPVVQDTATVDVEPNVAIASEDTLPAPPIQVTSTSTPPEEPLRPYFTAGTDMLCREGPSTSYVDRWFLKAGDIVEVLAQWQQDPSWLLVDINVPATDTRTDCCWVGAEGTLNVSLDKIKTINFLPDRLDCSAVK